MINDSFWLVRTIFVFDRLSSDINNMWYPSTSKARWKWHCRAKPDITNSPSHYLIKCKLRWSLKIYQTYSSHKMLVFFWGKLVVFDSPLNHCQAVDQLVFDELLWRPYFILKEDDLGLDYLITWLAHSMTQIEEKCIRAGLPPIKRQFTSYRLVNTYCIHV